MTQKIIDLQIHTLGSDGVFTPAQIVKKAKENKVAAIAITDHDSVAGIGEGLAAGKKLGIEVVPGIEFTCYRGEEELHVLGYFFDWQNQELAKQLTFFRQGRMERARKMVEKLRQLGFAITLKGVQRLAKEVVAKPHIAKAVIENLQNKKKLLKKFGRIPTIGQFIKAYLVLGRSAYTTKPSFTPEEAIEFIHLFGGLAVLSHPGYSLKVGEKEKLKQLMEQKLDGLEVIHPYFPYDLKKTQKIIKYFKGLTAEFSLLKTGGSDYHGKREGEIDIGLVNFPLEVPYQFLEGLKKRLNLCE